MVTLTYSGLPPEYPNKDQKEWLKIKPFVDKFNNDYNTNYFLHSLPELEDRNTAQPEVILRDGDSYMAIECKIITWPSNYIYHHRLWHDFNALIFEKLIKYFDDDIYILEIKDEQLPSNKRDITIAANKVCDEILQYTKEVRNDYTVYDNEPFGWKFFKLPEIERDDGYEIPGILFRLKMNSRLKTASENSEVREQLTKKIEGYFVSAAQKFKNYHSHLCVLLLEPYTDVTNMAYSQNLYEIISTTPVPVEISQIWLETPIEMEDGVLVPDYRLIFDQK